MLTEAGLRDYEQRHGPNSSVSEGEIWAEKAIAMIDATYKLCYENHFSQQLSSEKVFELATIYQIEPVLERALELAAPNVESRNRALEKFRTWATTVVLIWTNWQRVDADESQIGNFNLAAANDFITTHFIIEPELQDEVSTLQDSAAIISLLLEPSSIFVS